jgi:aminopeptidase N
MLRASQFSEDAGPMAHPIRPDSYIKMDNFYTVTVYEKVRRVLLGSLTRVHTVCAAGQSL